MGSFGALTKCLKKYYVTLTVIESLDGLLVYSVRPDFSTSPDVTLDWKVKTLYLSSPGGFSVYRLFITVLFLHRAN